MFNQKEIDTYQSISAPDSLRTKVLSLTGTQSKKNDFSLGFRVPWSFATCLVLVIAVCITANLRDTSIVISGTPIVAKHTILIEPEYDVVPIRMQHSKEELTESVAFSIQLDFPTETTISVSSGEMQILLTDPVSSSTTLTVNNKTTVIWYVTPNDSDIAFVMTLTSDSKSETLTLDYDKNTQSWTISRQVNQ